ncbi:MAG: RNA polymerase sigma factor [Nannocystaceae bacterium]
MNKLVPKDATSSVEETDDAPRVADEALMEAFREGDAASFEELTRRHRRGLFNFLLRSVGNRARAEELLQEVFLRVIRARERYVVTAKFTTWVYTIARNIAIDESRRAKFRRHRSLDAPTAMRDGEGPSLHERIPATQVSTDDAAQAPTIRDRVAAAVSQLPEEQREVFVMRQFRGMSFRQIGEVVGASENTAKSRMRYALEKLRKDLADIDPRDQASITSKEGYG